MKMNYFVFGTNDKEKAVSFYDELFASCGLGKIHDQGRMTLWGNQDFMFAIAEPFDEKAASNGNGTMLGFQVDSAEEVDRLHQKAIDLGGSSEGEPWEGTSKSMVPQALSQLANQGELLQA